MQKNNVKYYIYCNIITEKHCYSNRPIIYRQLYCIYCISLNAKLNAQNEHNK